MRVFLDTNVLASAFATRGLCEDVFREVITFHEFVVSRTVLTELETALLQKFRVPAAMSSDILEFLLSNATVAQQPVLLSLSISDEADIRIVSEAVSAAADILVTGDKEVASLCQVEGMRVLSPRQFWEHIRAEENNQG